jgi:hypothetical protein
LLVEDDTRGCSGRIGLDVLFNELDRFGRKEDSGAWAYSLRGLLVEVLIVLVDDDERVSLAVFGMGRTPT